MPAKLEHPERARPLESILKAQLDYRSPGSDSRAGKTGAGVEQLLTPNEAAQRLRVSLSWLSKARMRGDGPPYVKVGRSVRYTELGLLQWMRSCQRRSTSE
jgi:predicted DNA-binding transcriptional regulator AlpA